VHGAFAETTLWSGVIAALRHAAIEAVAVATPLGGLRSDAAYVASLAAAVGGDVVLAGHGYGGAVITAAATPNVTALVYVAAFAPDEGESCVGLLAGAGDHRALAAIEPAIVQRGDGPRTVEATLRRDRFRELAAGDLPAADALTAAATQRAVVAGALDERAAAPAWRRLPTWYVVATRDRMLPPGLQRKLAERAGADIVELDASHAVARSRPAEVAEVIARAAR
jgi:pimeloyl-ACP methyl ester carboxylesterase